MSAKSPHFEYGAPGADNIIPDEVTERTSSLIWDEMGWHHGKVAVGNVVQLTIDDIFENSPDQPAETS